MSSSNFIDISVLGSKKLSRKLNALENRVKSTVMRDAAKKAMEPVLSLAKQRAPVLTGLLRKHLKIAVYRGRGYAGAVVQTGTRKQMKIPAKAKFFYPAGVEYGTSKLRARPFLRSSLAAKRNVALGIMSKEIKRMLRA